MARSTAGRCASFAHIARVYDRGYGHFTTRQNIQYNWPKLADMPAILEELAEVEMHAIQTSGNCIRNVTADHFAGAAADEIADPRPYAKSCGNGRRCIPNSRSCRASSRSR
jgi:sulfite reductase beta subunit-like hemoprotein